jgi:hypothetical protein
MHDLELFESKESDTLPQLVGGSLLSRPLVLTGCLLSLAFWNYIKTGGPESAERFAKARAFCEFPASQHERITKEGYYRLNISREGDKADEARKAIRVAIQTAGSS